MKRLLSILVLCIAPLAYGEDCPAPKIKAINLEHKASNNQSLYFGGRYSANITPSPKVIFSNDMLAYIYSKEKHFVIHGDTEIKEENKNETLHAFGLNNDQSESFLRKGLNLCAGEITQYHITGMPETIIAVNSFVADRPSTMVYLFNEVSPFVERIQFLSFTQQEIEQTLSTLRNVRRK